MNNAFVSNDSTLSLSWGTQAEKGGPSQGRWLSDGESVSDDRQWIGLSKIENDLIRTFAAIPEVNALYAEKDDDGLLMVFVVVPEHDASTYERVLAAEESVRQNICGDFELRVRAHQGRTTTKAVPMRTLPLFLK